MCDCVLPAFTINVVQYSIHGAYNISTQNDTWSYINPSFAKEKRQICQIFFPAIHHCYVAMSFYVKAIVTSHSEKNSQLEVQYSEGGNEVLLSCQDASAKLSSAAYQKLQEFLDWPVTDPAGHVDTNWGFFLPYRSIIILYIYMLNFLKQSHHFDCTRHVVWCFKFCWGRLCLIIHCYISYHRAIGDPHSTCLHCSQEPPFSNHAFYGWRSTNFTNWKKLCQTCFRRRILFLECKAWTYGMLVYIPVPWSIWDYSNISYPTIHERGKNWLYSVPKKRIASAVQLWSFLIWQSWCRYCEDVFVSCCIVTQPVANHMSI